VAPIALSKRWVADFMELEESRGTNQANLPNSEAKLKRTGQGKRSQHDAAKSSANSQNASSFKFDQDLEQLIHNSTSMAIHGSTRF